MHDFDLIDLETYVRLREAAPLVTVVPGDIARDLILALMWWSVPEKAHKDKNNRTYWQASLKELSEYEDLKESNIPLMMLGRACREMGLVMVRKSGGYQTAWSLDQLDILTSIGYGLCGEKQNVSAR